ncbi:MAG: glycosyltransferase family 2 protein [Rhodoferax sp.]|uniref:glycosyltransferase family 2 protein n=1 Tax=Rhodoferax sp. TaxID=50421 RepID=UPI002ACDEC76|nr:glycosyltransferase family 2 protein [Rhodoferax sp.]MDZ7891342.1 glycosyltransferase family 2 protein [Rhodoferax sp.]
MLKETPQTNIKQNGKIRLCILLTYFNRKDKTIECFNKVRANSLPENTEVTAVVVDDGSTDGTADALHSQHPWINIARAAGNLYWCKGMHQAFDIARKSDPDFYVWLNDDTMLQPDALARLLATERELRAAAGQAVVVVGSTVDEKTGLLTYGGSRRLSALKRMRFARIQPSDKAQQCDAMNGNLVLVSKEAANIVGNLDPTFEHAMGDTDYALRANKLGVQVWVAPGVYGTCSNNSIEGTYMDESLPFTRRWQLMMHRKGLPWRSWLALTSRHAGPAWPLYFCWPYLSLTLGLYKKKKSI